MSRGLDLFRERLAGRPAALRELLERPDPPPPFDPRRVRRIVVTGIGSSAAHARFLAHVLSEELGLPARFSPTGAVAVGTPPGSLNDALIVFSQGLSPNARFAFARAHEWGSAVLVTAQGASREGGERAEWFESLRDRGVRIVELPVVDEFGTLLRVVGPMLGLASALGLARSLGRELGVEPPTIDPDPVELVERVEAAPAAVAAALGEGSVEPRLSGSLALLASGGYGELLHNLSTKFLEGIFRRAPLWDGLEFAHGGLQQLWPGRGLVLHLARAGNPGDRELADALGATLAPERHEYLALEAAGDGPAAVFEHEAMIDALLLRWFEEQGADPTVWPAKGSDGPLYERSPGLDRTALPRALERARWLEHTRWPELEAEGSRTAVLALGSVEQHGPHLPLGTDAWIARWLVERVAARIEGAVALPVMPIGCASEHAAFPGTLSLEPATLEGVLCDLLRSLAGHGFEAAFVFSAHGGNLGMLRDSRAALQRAASPIALRVYDDHRSLARVWAAAGAAAGIRGAEQGQHAGELETSILLGLAPGAVAMDRAEIGRIVEAGDAQSLFYPSLRDHAPSGVLGDPSLASAERADGYLEAWVTELVDFYRSGPDEERTE